ncbi:BatD family protein [Rhodoferax sp.]|uniref:BatD family protein n=1 Tax=Rhodoferax sp. TaxID=50421 RepID=UPI0028517818|nr:BatD family protein [Rhodoferax sp.]MDR3370990.1 BatD family protein [Rhodoferax sp.]
MKKTIHHLAVALLAGILSLPALATTTASLDRTQVALGDTVRLLVQTDASTDKQPDIGPLQQDFAVLGSSHGSSTQIINGHISSQTQVTLFLSPKHEGTIRIPPLSWGAEQSAALELTVGGSGNAPAQGDAGQAGAAPVSMSATLDQKHPYVQSSVVLTLRLSVGVPLTQASLDMPGSADVLVKQLGEDTQTTESRNGRNYQVIERKYLLIPQRSGQINLKGPTLDAQVQDSNMPDINSFFGNAFGNIPLGRMMGSTRPLRLSAESIVLNVQPRPAAATGADWLPAQKVTLDESWRPDNASVHVGEPLTRHLHLTALGLTGTQLPDLSKLMTVPDGIKPYPDQAKTDESVRSGTMLGSRDQDIALIASQPGHYELPALKVAWWDTVANVQREATLPARSLDVLPAADGQAAQTPPATNNAPVALPTQGTPGNALHVDLPPGSAMARASVWPWVSAVLALLWLGTGVAWWRARHAPAQSAPVPSTASPAPAGRLAGLSSSKSLSELQRACRDNDAQAARQAVLSWAASFWPDSPPRGLKAVAQRLADPRFTEPLQQLDRACYAGSAAWQGASLAQAFAQSPRQAAVDKVAPVIPDLYG